MTYFFKSLLFKTGQKSVFCGKVGILAELGNFSSGQTWSVGCFLKEKRGKAALLFQAPPGCKHCSAAGPNSGLWVKPWSVHPPVAPFAGADGSTAASAAPGPSPPKLQRDGCCC